MQKKVAIIDYNLGNVFSVQQAFAHIGVESFLTSDPRDFEQVHGIVLPGVGAFGMAMDYLKSQGLDEGILTWVEKGRPFMGVCLGMHLLFKSSTEFGERAGLGLLDGTVRHLGQVDTSERIPLIGWNSIGYSEEGRQSWQGTPLVGMKAGERCYFVHSFFVDSDPKYVLSVSPFGGQKYCSSVLHENIFATQFHPEKSGHKGLGIYKEWVESF